MSGLTIGIFGRSKKENEWRLPIHPDHFDRMPAELRQRMFLEQGYASKFGSNDSELGPLVGGVASRDELIEKCDIILLPKPLEEDLEEMRDGQILWGWPHCVQNERLTQIAIDKKLTLIAWEAMNHWFADGNFDIHVFNTNNELAGYCSVLHAMQLIGVTGQYGKRLRAAIISFGATGRGALAGLKALGIRDVTVLTQRKVAQLPDTEDFVSTVQFGRTDEHGDTVVAATDEGTVPLVDVLARHDIIVNCVLQDTDDPLMFVRNGELDRFPRGTLFVDVSCDEGMGFEWAVPTSFEDPLFDVGDGVHYYAVDHSPSFMWNTTTWEISDSLLPYLPTVLDGPSAWGEDLTINRAIEIRDGVIQNPKILSFQDRSPEYPHPKN